MVCEGGDGGTSRPQDSNEWIHEGKFTISLFQWSSNVARFHFHPFYFVGMETRKWQQGRQRCIFFLFHRRIDKTLIQVVSQPHKSHLFNSPAAVQDAINPAVRTRPAVLRLDLAAGTWGGSIVSINSNFFCDYCRVNSCFSQRRS